MVADVTSQDDVDEDVRRAGTIDILINNAGIMDFFLPVGEVDDEIWRRVLGTNLDGPMRLTRAVSNGMRERGQGRSSTSHRSPGWVVARRERRTR